MEIPDADINYYAANTIHQKIYSKIDADSYSRTTLGYIIEYPKNEKEVSKDEKYVTTSSGNRRIIKSTVGGKFVVQWKDVTEQWSPLKIFKEYNPLEVAEFYGARHIQYKPELWWWFSYTQRNRDNIISAVKLRIHKSLHKYGMEFPTYVKQAKHIDEKNGNQVWKNAIKNKWGMLMLIFKFLTMEIQPLSDRLSLVVI